MVAYFEVQEAGAVCTLISWGGMLPLESVAREQQMKCSQSEQIRDVFYFTVVINSVTEVTEFYFDSTLGAEPKF